MNSKLLLIVPTVVAALILYIDHFYHNPGNEIKFAIEALLFLGVVNGVLFYLRYKKPLISLIISMLTAGLYYGAYVLTSLFLIAKSFQGWEF
jgi:hypothetical protein